MDINAIKKRLNQLQSTNTRTSNLWKPQPGKQQVRIVPYKFNPDTPFIELFFHYNLGGKNYLSPISFGRPDPIEEFSQRLKTTGSKDDFTLGRKLEAKMKCGTLAVFAASRTESVFSTLTSQNSASVPPVSLFLAARCRTPSAPAK